MALVGGAQPPQPRPPLLHLALPLQLLELLVLAAVAADGRVRGSVVCSERVGEREIEGKRGGRRVETLSCKQIISPNMCTY